MLRRGKLLRSHPRFVRGPPLTLPYLTDDARASSVGQLHDAGRSGCSPQRGYLHLPPPVLACARALCRYKDTSHRLMFDLMVEPAEALGSDIATLNKAYALATSQIRPSNPTRIIAFAPGHIASADYLDQMVIPPSAAPYAMAEWHTFAAGPNPSPSSKKHWTGNGTAAQRQAFEQLVGEAHAWQQSAPNGVPTWFGAWMSSNFNHGSDYTRCQSSARLLCLSVRRWRADGRSTRTYSIFFNATSDIPLPSLLPILQIIESC